MTALLAVADLHAHYGDSHVLRGVSIEIPAGVSFGLLGRNGMGKTTLIRSALGYLRSTSGSVAWSGKPVTGAPPERMARLGIGYVPEGRGIFANLSVRENLVMTARAVLRHTDRAAVLEKGRIVLAGASATLAADGDALARHLGV